MRAWEIPTVLGQLERANLNHWTSYETLCSLEYLMIDRVQKLSNSKCYSPSLEHFRIYNSLLLIFRDHSIKPSGKKIMHGAKDLGWLKLFSYKVRHIYHLLELLL
jgi:hypothetical protein